MSSCASLQHLIIDGSPKWDIYRTVPVSLSGSSSAAASMPQASRAAPAAKREALPAPAKRDPLLEAATAGGVLLDSGKYTFQVKATFYVCQCGIKNARRLAEWDMQAAALRMLVSDFKKDFGNISNPMAWSQVGFELTTRALHCRLIRAQQKQSRMLHRATQQCLQEKQMLMGAG